MGDLLEGKKAEDVILTVGDLEARWHVDRDAVTTLIGTGELPAFNIARHRDAKRPSWRIKLSDVEALEAARSSVPSKQPEGKPAIRKTGDAVLRKRSGSKVFV